MCVSDRMKSETQLIVIRIIKCVIPRMISMMNVIIVVTGK